VGLTKRSLTTTAGVNVHRNLAPSAFRTLHRQPDLANASNRSLLVYPRWFCVLGHPLLEFSLARVLVGTSGWSYAWWRGRRTLLSNSAKRAQLKPDADRVEDGLASPPLA
jgi:hypothetical protein